MEAGYIHFVDWSLIKLSEFYISHIAMWSFGSRVIYQEKGYALMAISRNINQQIDDQ